MYMSWLDAGSFWPLLLAVELLPGESCGARLQVSLFVSFVMYTRLHCSLIFIIIACIIITVVIILNINS